MAFPRQSNDHFFVFVKQILDAPDSAFAGIDCVWGAHSLPGILQDASLEAELRKEVLPVPSRQKTDSRVYTHSDQFSPLWAMPAQGAGWKACDQFSCMLATSSPFFELIFNTRPAPFKPPTSKPRSILAPGVFTVQWTKDYYLSTAIVLAIACGYLRVLVFFSATDMIADRAGFRCAGSTESATSSVGLWMRTGCVWSYLRIRLQRLQRRLSHPSIHKFGIAPQAGVLAACARTLGGRACSVRISSRSLTSTLRSVRVGVLVRVPRRHVSSMSI